MSSRSGVLSFAPFELDEALHELRCRGECVHIPPKQFALLRYLIQHRDRRVQREELLDALWADSHNRSGDPVSRELSEVRKLLRRHAPEAHWIETRRKQGVRFVGPVQVQPPAAAAERGHEAQAPFAALLRDWLRRSHDRLPRLGRTELPALHQVFVELSVYEQLPSDELAARAKPPEAARVSLGELLQRAGSPSRAPRWLVLGDPGAGKSTSARHLVWERAGELSGPTVLYAPLDALAGAECHPFDWVERELVADVGPQGRGLSRWLFGEAERLGALWLLLDGLDEVHPAKRRWLRERLSGWAQTLPRVTLCVLSRAAGSLHAGPEYANRAQLGRLSEAQRAFLLRKWLGEGERARAVAWAIECSPSLREASRVPLLLVLLVLVQGNQSTSSVRSLPALHRELFRTAIRTLLERGHALGDARGVQNPCSAYEVLTELCGELQAGGAERWTLPQLVSALRELRRRPGTRTREIFEDGTWADPHAFFDDLATRSGVLAQGWESTGERWTFLHRPFLEVLAAQAGRRDRGADPLVCMSHLAP